MSTNKMPGYPYLADPSVIPKRWNRHPWDEWFKLGSFILQKGKDYAGRTDTMMSQVRQQASKRGLRASVTATNDGNEITVVLWDGASTP